ETGRQGGGTKHHYKVSSDNIQGITKPGICNLAHSGGVKCISGLINEESCGVLKVFLEKLIQDANACTQYDNRRAMDVVYVFSHWSCTPNGFDG
uniref:Histone H4 n=1 Tax=Apteryx owenii TaxID=8824 RepID=A0A8B9S618_APTOW